MPESPRPSLAEFEREVEQAIRALGYEGALVRDAAQGRLGLAAGGALHIETLYDQLAGLEVEQRRFLLEKAARHLLHPPVLPATWAEVAPLLRLAPKLQIDVVAEELRRQAGHGPARIHVAMLTPHLGLELVVPMSEGRLTVPAETLATWGVTPEQAFHRAGANDAPDAHLPWRASSQRPGVYRSPWDDDRAGGRLISPRAFAGMPCLGRPVVMVTKPGMMLAAGSDDPAGLVQLAEEALKQARVRPGLLSGRAMCLTADGLGWEDWLPPAGHRAYQRFRLLSGMQEVRDAAIFAERIDDVARAKNQDALKMPRLDLVQESNSGVALTVTTWRSGSPVALPKADAIVLRRGATTLGWVGWDDLARALPGQLKPLPGYPARHLATDFPEDWQLGMLELKPWTPPREAPPPGA